MAYLTPHPCTEPFENTQKQPTFLVARERPGHTGSSW